MKPFLFCLLGALAACAQTPTATISLNSPLDSRAVGSDRSSVTGKANDTVIAGSPLLGFAVGPGPVDLRAIIGTAETARISEPLPIPENAARLYLPPGQHYALVEQSSDRAMEIWPLGVGTASGEKVSSARIPGSMSHPDLIAFSPRGEAAVLYSKTSGIVHIITGLPAHQAVLRKLSALSLGELTKIAISDDGSVILTQDATGQIRSGTDNQTWRLLPLGYTLFAWSFIPNTHDLVISDTTQNAIVILSNPTDINSAHRILADGLQADLLAVTRDGKSIMAADRSTAKSWMVDLTTGQITTNTAPTDVEYLHTMRDGKTFLASAFPVLYIFKNEDRLSFQTPQSFWESPTKR